MADCRETCRLLRSPAVAKGPAFWRARISASCPSRRASCRACPAWLGRLGQVRQERSRDSLIYVGRGSPSGQVDGQLVHHGLQRISCCYAGQSGVVGGSDVLFIAAVVG